MKKLLAAAVALGFSASAAVAGPYTSYSSKGQVDPPPAPMGCACFDGGALEVSAFAAGFVPASDNDTNDDNEWGGGVGVGYFFSPNVGVEVNYAAISTEKVTHLVTGNVVLRAPITDLCIAPYLLVGGGVHSNSVTQGIWNLGGGLDIRLNQSNCFGIFADAVYTWAEDTDDYTVIRAGVRVNF